ncbi:hypothetical protein FGRMN_375 [Fusarium graminum]|nr:hypothetical protein FGRMN_375 [Fusarium graminum]
MFRPKEPFNDSETIQTSLIETVDGVPTLSSQCVQFAKERPDDFVNYLRHAWEHEGESVKDTPHVLRSLKSLKLNVVDKFNLEIQAFYIPIPKLLYLRNRYLLPQENFPFFNLQPEIPSDSDLGPWAFLQDIIGNNAKDDLRFYINLLIFLKRGNRKGAVQFPRRVLELYLRIHALCDGPSDVRLVRQWFSDVSLILSEKGWTSPFKCYTRAPKELAVATPCSILLPPPDDWEVSDFELTALQKFYKETLGIWEGSLGRVLVELGSRPTDVETVKQLYHALDRMRPGLTKFDITLIRSAFKKREYIFLPGNESPWHRLADCVWGRQLQGAELKNPGLFYPELESFFVDFLGLPTLDIGVVYSDLINLGNNITLNFTGSREENAKKLLVKLNDDIVEYGKFLDKEKLLQSNIFPVAQTDGHVRLCSMSSDFYIADRQYLHDSFHNKTDLLDLEPAVIWALEPFFLWAGLKGRYLSNVVTEASEIEGKAVDTELSPFMHPSRVMGLLRIAVHFDSPRVATAAGLKSLDETLENTKIHPVTGNRLKSYLCIDREGKQRIVVKSPFPVVKIEEDSDGYLDIFMDSHLPNYSMARTVPRCLARWLMTEPGAETIEQVDVRIEEHVKTVFRLTKDNVGAIRMIFDAEGIVDVKKLMGSPYLTRKNKRVSPRVLSTESSPSEVIGDLPAVLDAEPSPPMADQVLYQVPPAKRKSPTRGESPSTESQNPALVPIPQSTAPSRRVLGAKPPSRKLKQLPDRGVGTNSSASAVSQVLPQWPGVPTSSALWQTPSGAPSLQFDWPPLVYDDKPCLSASGKPLRESSAYPSPYELFQGQDRGDNTGPSSSKLFQVPPRTGSVEPPCPSTLNPESSSLGSVEAQATGDVLSPPTQNEDTLSTDESEDGPAEVPATTSAPLSPAQNNDSPSTVEPNDSPEEAPATGNIPSPPVLRTDSPLASETKNSPEESPAPGDMPSPPAQTIDSKYKKAEALADTVLSSPAASSTDNKLPVESCSGSEESVAPIDMPSPPAENPDGPLTIDLENISAEAPENTTVSSPPELNTGSQLPIESESSPEERPVPGVKPPPTQSTDSTSTAGSDRNLENAPTPSAVLSPPELSTDFPSTVESKCSPSLTITFLP